MKLANWNNQKGFSMTFVLIVLGALASFAIAFPLTGRMIGLLSKDYFYGTDSRYLAELGVETVRARIQTDVLRLPLVQLRMDSNENGSWAEDVDVLTPRGVLDQQYSTRRDGIDQDGDSTIDEPDEIYPVGSGGQGFYTEVRDLGRGIDLNLASPDAPLNSPEANLALKYNLARFPTINEISVGPDTITTGGIVDAIVDYRNTVLGGRYHSIEELRSVPGMTDGIYNEIKSYVTATTPNEIIGGGLIGHYYDEITGYPNNVQFDYDSYAGSVIEKGAGGFKKGGSFAFYFDSSVDLEGATVDTTSFSPATINPRPITFTRNGVLENDSSPGSVFVPTTKTTFGVRWEGFIYIPEDMYTAGSSAPLSFRIIASGGARMKIAGIPVIKTQDFWDSEHAGSSKFSSSDFFEVNLALGTFQTGWQPIEIEYWCYDEIPVFILIWNQGFRFRPGSAGDTADPDTDMGTQTLIVPSASMGYKAGGFYEIRSTGVVLNPLGQPETEKTVVARYHLFNHFHDTLARDFDQGSYPKGKVSIRDSYPVAPTNTWYETNEEFERAAPHRRQYDTVANSIKLGYWTNFDEAVDDWTTSEGYFGWKPRNAETTLALTDVDGDGDRELAITSNDNLNTDPYINAFNPTALLSIPAADLVGTGTIAAPDPDYTNRYFFLRFREIANRGPIDRVAGMPGGVNPPDTTWKNNLEDYKDPVSDSTNFNADSNPNPDGPLDPGNPGFYLEDKNLSGTISSIPNNDGPHSSWVGQPLLRRTDGSGGDWIFYTEQFWPGPNGTATRDNYPSGHGKVQFRRNNGQWGNMQSFSGWGYNNNGYEWLMVNGKTSWWSGDLTWLFQNRPVTDTGVGNIFTYLGFTNNLGLNQNVTLGYRSLGNEASYPRAIDSIRFFPVRPQYHGLGGSPSATFTSRVFDAGEPVTWGAISWIKHPPSDWTDSGGNLILGYQYSKTDLRFTTDSSPTPNPTTIYAPSAPRGGMALIPSSLDGNRYARYGLDFQMKQYDPINTNTDPPIFEEFAVTYFKGAERFYLREGIKED